jgi:hypothetical protein
VQLVIADAHLGLRQAVQAVMAGAAMEGRRRSERLGAAARFLSFLVGSRATWQDQSLTASSPAATRSAFSWDEEGWALSGVRTMRC